MNGKKRRALLLMIITILLLLIGGSIYLSRMKNILWEQSVSNILEVTVQGGKAFEVYINQGHFMTEGQSDSFTQYSSADKDAITGRLDHFANGDLSFAVLDLTNKVIYYNSRESAELSDDTVNEYQALPKQGVLEPFINEYDGRRVMGYYEKFKFADGALGVVRKSILISDVSEQFSLSFYNGAGFSYIVNAEGNIMIRSVEENGNRTFNNVFDVVALNDNTDESVAAFRDFLSAGKKGVMRFNFNGEEHIFAFVPVHITNGWYLVSVVPNNVIMEYANQMMMRSQIMVWGIIVAMFAFATFIFVSIQHRKQVEAKEIEVRYHEQLFNLLVHNSDDVFLMLGSDRRTVIYISPNVERVIGVSVDEAKEDVTCLQNVIHGIEHEEEFIGDLDLPLDGSTSFEGNYLHQTTGEMRWFVENVYHTLIEKTERYIVILADRTDEKQKESALKEALEIAEMANKSKSNFLANMSHDIRTPMNAIVGLTTLLQRDADNPENVREYANKINSSSQHLLGLINDVLDMSKIENGKTSINVGEFSLAKLIQELDSIIRLQSKSKRQTFEITVQDIQYENMIGDKQRISQVLMNILSNAVKYTPEEGRITLLVQQLGRRNQDLVHIRFVVTDNGIGMSKDYLEEIFQPFTREVRTTVNQIQGTGLGMAITKNLVELMGGAISVESEQGVGSCLTIDFDLRIAPNEDDSSFWTSHNISKILVIDDEEDNCIEILNAMSDTGVKMQYALSGPAAIDMILEANKDGEVFDLILLDWKMPEMDGIETAKRIQSLATHHIPTMISTSYDWEDIRDKATAAGIDGFLAKPFFLSNFKELIRSMQVKAPEDAPASLEVDDSIAGYHFLCAEDNELNAEILFELLNYEGVKAEIAVNGQEAVEKFSSAPAGTYDAILMDVQMPVMDGYQATRAIRNLEHPQAKSIPIVAMTANAFADDIRLSLDAGMNEHISKPIDMKKVKRVLSRLLKEQES